MVWEVFSVFPKRVIFLIHFFSTISFIFLIIDFNHYLCFISRYCLLHLYFLFFQIIIVITFGYVFPETFPCCMFLTERKILFGWPIIAISKYFSSNSYGSVLFVFIFGRNCGHNFISCKIFFGFVLRRFARRNPLFDYCFVSGVLWWNHISSTVMQKREIFFPDCDWTTPNTLADTFLIFNCRFKMKAIIWYAYGLYFQLSISYIFSIKATSMWRPER